MGAVCCDAGRGCERPLGSHIWCTYGGWSKLGAKPTRLRAGGVPDGPEGGAPRQLGSGMASYVPISGLFSAATVEVALGDAAAGGNVGAIGASGLPGKLVFLGVVIALALVVQRVLVRLASKALDSSNVPSASIYINILRAIIWSFALLAVLEPVFGVQPTAFVTALGVTSVVISLGLQDTISNVIGGLGLMMGHVVQPGDYVVVSGFEGFVTDVNWRSTTVEDRNGNVHVIPNSVLNKSAFTRKGPATRGSCAVEFTVDAEADLAQVSEEVVRLATEALGELRDPAYPVSVLFSDFDSYGTHGAVWVHVTDDAGFSAARDVVARVLQGRPWLAHR